MGGSCVSRMLVPPHATPNGEHDIGTLRARLPPEPGYLGQHGLLAQLHYPADVFAPMLDVDPMPWFREEVLDNMSELVKLPTMIKSAAGRVKQLDPSYAPLKPSGDGWPLVLFSHGLCGSCEMYTQMCREMASAGAIVVAIEHEDGSGIFARSAETAKEIAYKRMPSGWKDARDSVTAAQRHPTLEQHAAEISATVATLVAAAEGKSLHPVADLEAADGPLASVLRYGDPEQLVLVGHSFGGAGVVRYLRHLRERRQRYPCKAALLLDVWMGPLVTEDVDHGLQVHFALLQSEEWPVTDRLRTLVRSSGGNFLGGISVLGTSHQWVSESQYFGPRWLLRRSGVSGPGNYVQYAHATFNMVIIAIRTLLEPTLGAKFYERAQSINANLLKPLLPNTLKEK